jgi:hypothetical protein
METRTQKVIVLEGRSSGVDRLASLFQGESHFEGSVQLLDLGARQGADEAC